MNVNPKKPEAEDEVEKSRAPLMDHLIELRKRLIRSVLALIACFFVVFYFSQAILEILIVPYHTAVALYENEGAEGFGIGALWQDTQQFVTGLFDGDAPPAQPAVEASEAGAPAEEEALAQMQATGPLEIFIVKIRLSMIGALALGFPILAWQIYAFVAPGLYKKERGALLPFLLAMPFLFVLGGALVYYVILPLVMSFSLSQQFRTETVSVALVSRVNEYFGLVTALLLAFGCMFQMPVVLTLLGKAGFVSSKGLRKAWKYAVVAVFVLSAIVTPPDMISQILLAVPMLLLYEVSIWCVKLIEAGRAKEEAAAA